MYLRPVFMCLGFVVLSPWACGGDGNKSLSGTAGPADTSVAAAKSKAGAAALKATDLPEGWTEQPAERRPDHESTWTNLTTCLAIEGAESPREAIAVSPTYGSGDGSQVTSAVFYLDSAARVDEIKAIFATDRLQECAQTAFAEDALRNAPPGTAVGEVGVVSLPRNGPGPATWAHRATTTLTTANGGSALLVEDFVTAFKGAAVVRLTFMSRNAPVSETLQRSLLEAVLGRT